MIAQMVSPFSEDSSMGLTEEDFSVAAGLEGGGGAFEELVVVEDCAVECDDLAGALGVASAVETDFLSGRDLAATFAGEPLGFLVFGLDCFVVDFGFDFLLSPPVSSCTASDISL